MACASIASGQSLSHLIPYEVSALSLDPNAVVSSTYFSPQVKGCSQHVQFQKVCSRRNICLASKKWEELQLWD